MKEFHATYAVVDTKIGKIQDNKQLDIDKLKLAYRIFFSGKDIFSKEIKKGELSSSFNKEVYNGILKELEILRTCHKEGVRYLSKYNKKYPLHLDISYKPFGGHVIRFAHFYRHMYAIVNFVVNQNNEILTYMDKRRYLKMFRAQLSNYEIALLYYNWLGDFGKAWEESREGEGGQKKPNRFFTDYRMIHNLSKHLVLDEFDPEVLFNQIKFNSFLYKHNEKEADLLFELYDIKSQLTEAENLRQLSGM